MPDVPSALPASLIAGDTWVWERELADYPQPTWVATAHFEKQGATFTVVAAANGTAHRFNATALITADYVPGRYRWRVRVTDGTQTFTAESGWLEVEVDPAAAGTYDTRSWAARTLEAVEAFLAGNASSAQQTVQIAGRLITRWSLSELIQWRDKLRNEVRAEGQSGQSGAGRTIKVKLRRA